MLFAADQHHVRTVEDRTMARFLSGLTGYPNDGCSL